jgi:hypothetical protein
MHFKTFLPFSTSSASQDVRELSDVSGTAAPSTEMADRPKRIKRKR